MLSYQHQLASKCFLACLDHNPNCALAHGLISMCHAPNYNFMGPTYYDSSCHNDDVNLPTLLCAFPSQQVADRHSRLAIEKIEELRQFHTQGERKQVDGISDGGQSNDAKEHNDLISDIESQLLSAIRVLTCKPGVDPAMSEEVVGRPHADAMAKVYAKYPDDPDIAYCYVDSLMVLNAWKLYDYPSGDPASPDVDTARNALERSLEKHPHHAGLCHLHVHVLEMSSNPEQALKSCESLRVRFPHAGHLIHMGTHIDVLLGDYESCYLYNCIARDADVHVMKSHPEVAETKCFYFGYIAHDYHMGVYGAILGGMEKAAMDLALEMNTMVNEGTFEEYPFLGSYLEAYSAMEVHVMIRFGRWEQLLEIPLPKNQSLMVYRAASIRYGRALAYAMTGRIEEAKVEAEEFELVRKDPETGRRVLHNNLVADLLHLDSVMMHGEIEYKSGNYSAGLELLEKAVTMQDNLNFDEPWGKMQPIRHAYGGLLNEQGRVDEAIEVFRTDLKFHPKNPWALVGLISCLKKKLSEKGCCSKPVDGGDDSIDGIEKTKTNETLFEKTSDSEVRSIPSELAQLEEELRIQRQGQYADFDISVPCECCKRQ